ncbi:MAG: hypothetical protein WA821_09950 [Anaerolineales bacterium]
MTSFRDEQYWQAMQTLLFNAQIVIDRPKGRPHPRYPDVIYPLDYGYLEGTTAGDGNGIDVWVGSQAEKTLTGILCTFDAVKRDAEIKLLVGCSAQDVETVLRFFNEGLMRYLYIPKPKE